MRCHDTYLGQRGETGLGEGEGVVLQAQSIHSTEFSSVLGELLGQISRVLDAIDTALTAVEFDVRSTGSFGDLELVALSCTNGY
jgi:hypothetical protein